VTQYLIQANGIVESRAYDTRGRLTGITAAGVLDRALTWLPESNISAIGSSDPYANQSFGYDMADRLASASGSYGSLGYTYDANSNRMSRSDATGTEPYVYATGTNRLLTAQWPNASTKRFEYDGAGNQTRRGGLLFTYAANNRNTSVTRLADGSLVGAYVYNGKGERVKRTVYPAVNPPATFLYVYDPSGNLIGEYDELGNLRNEYVYGPTGRLATLKKWYGGTKWHHNDHLGTPQALTNNAGITVWTMTQTPFGIATINKDPDGDGINVTNNARFPGQYWDWETQTNYNYFRSYDPRTGYTQSDPIGLNGGMNTFTYVGGNPINAIDPFGLAATVVATPLPNGGFSFSATGSGLDGSITGTFNTGTINYNQIRPGSYSVTPRPALPASFINWLLNRNEHAGRPTISNTDDWNTIRYPDGSVTRGAQFHPGRNGTNSGISQACMVTDQATYDSLNELFQNNYNDGGVTLIVNPGP